MKILGRYSSYEYEVILTNEKGKSELLYSAGNNPYESEGVVDAPDGVGSERMKEYCEISSKEIAEEKGIEYYGVEFDEEKEQMLKDVFSENKRYH